MESTSWLNGWSKKISISLFCHPFLLTLRREDGRDRDGEDVLALDSLNASNLGLTQVIECMFERNKLREQYQNENSRR